MRSVPSKTRDARGRRTVGRAIAALVALAIGGGASSGCGTDAVGVETCRTIETARCQQAPRCPDINLDNPVHRDSPKTDVEACVRFYRDACLHGLSAGDPGGPATQACVAAINTGDCTTVLHPETNAACLWLNPAPDAGVDAPAQVVDAADGAPE